MSYHFAITDGGFRIIDQLIELAVSLASSDLFYAVGDALDYAMLDKGDTIILIKYIFDIVENVDLQNKFHKILNDIHRSLNTNYDLYLVDIVEREYDKHGRYIRNYINPLIKNSSLIVLDNGETLYDYIADISDNLEIGRIVASLIGEIDRSSVIPRNEELNNKAHLDNIRDIYNHSFDYDLDQFVDALMDYSPRSRRTLPYQLDAYGNYRD